MHNHANIIANGHETSLSAIHQACLATFIFFIFCADSMISSDLPITSIAYSSELSIFSNLIPSNITGNHPKSASPAMYKIHRL